MSKLPVGLHFSKRDILRGTILQKYLCSRHRMIFFSNCFLLYFLLFFLNLHWWYCSSPKSPPRGPGRDSNPRTILRQAGALTIKISHYQLRYATRHKNLFLECMAFIVQSSFDLHWLLDSGLICSCCLKLQLLM